jgi:hypothetical protein
MSEGSHKLSDKHPDPSLVGYASKETVKEHSHEGWV